MDGAKGQNLKCADDSEANAPNDSPGLLSLYGKNSGIN